MPGQGGRGAIPALPRTKHPRDGGLEHPGLKLLLWGHCCPPGSAGSALLVPESSVCLESSGQMVWLAWLSVCLPLVPTAGSESLGTASASLPRVLSNSPPVKNKGMVFLG